MKIDRIDAQILNELQQDARLKTTELAERVCLSATPCTRRLKQLEEAGMIDRYVTLLDQEKAGFPVNAYISLTLEPKAEATFRKFEQQIATFDEVMECHLMSGSHDFMLRVVAASLSDFEKFLQKKLIKIEGLRDVQSSFSLRRLIHKTALPVKATV
ncbi:MULTISPECIES: Lrp/AsnC family transcriptional regulator [Dickeya]|uniref:Lrp/AsnC family transcriptional regulator n=1 Tax=Dickeya oryzae TaxID=1240404 RepID=A0AB39IQH7_9GAMM|nr:MULTISPECIES: Lrp/AsnC family transcriptional regulator [Dickeya]PXW45656.1 AsnC family transcriptional regulator [Erwinia sp. AG740]MBP2846277.1 Lrp/AsnC family transcriptional regulator [Dickeya oryzae]MBP2849866.1 Lrp/AsnC family transcriptional regulator [Dickeya oryzae]MBP2857812.1 Lrp/AsnC family transcriptional regulator [Dickeya oryzae]MCA6990202.1 Lrp/AsnC family transcriptional regulator [Dickeya oryzae]